MKVGIYKMKDSRMISVVIPALNEENYLPLLLKSLKQQEGVDYEIIVADGYSSDRTRDIARSNGCRIVRGGSASEGRNAGARVAKGDSIFFFDADVIIPERRFLYDCIKEMNAQNLDIATCYCRGCDGPIIDRKLHDAYNILVKLAQRVYPIGHGYCIIVGKSLHKKTGGFDTGIKIAEDIDYVKRASKMGRFGMINGTVLVSTRRLQNDGRLRFIFKFLFWAGYRFATRGEIRKKFRWDFLNYNRVKPQIRERNKD